MVATKSPIRGIKSINHINLLVQGNWVCFCARCRQTPEASEYVRVRFYVFYHRCCVGVGNSRWMMVIYRIAVYLVGSRCVLAIRLPNNHINVAHGSSIPQRKITVSLHRCYVFYLLCIWNVSYLDRGAIIYIENARLGLVIDWLSGLNRSVSFHYSSKGH